MFKATKTLEMIENSVAEDGGAAFRQTLEGIIPKMEDAYRGSSKPFRNHLGASLLGRECGRELWYSFHWATKPTFPPRILRLFNRGHLEEARFLALLISCGLDVWYETEDGGQFKFSDIGGHFGSALDAVIRGIPDIPEDVPVYGEFKTSAEKGFNKLAANGVEMEKPEHYTQMQLCMHEMNLPYALYMVVNKNNDELHAEIIKYDSRHAARYLDRGREIIFSSSPLPKIGDSVSWWKCRYCDQKGVCHQTEVPEVNCRTCAHSTPLEDGTWECGRGNQEIHTDAVFEGCNEHVFNPTILNGVEYHGGNAELNAIDITLPNGDRILQGPNHITSKELKKRGL